MFFWSHHISVRQPNVRVQVVWCVVQLKVGSSHESMHAYPILFQPYTHLHLKVLVTKHAFPECAWYMYMLYTHTNYTLTTRSVCKDSLLPKHLVSISSSKQEISVIQVLYFADCIGGHQKE